MKLRTRLVLLILVFGMFISQQVQAQCDPFFDPFCEDVDVPLDTEAVYAVIVAAIAGGWYILKRKKLSATQA